MKVLRLILVIAIGVAASGAVDGLLSGVLFHDAYRASADIWRTDISEGGKIGLSMAISVVGVVGFALLIARAGRPTLGAGLKAAVLAWLAGPVPVVLTDLVWTKMTPTVGAVTGAEWLIRFIIVALAAAWLI